MRGERERERSGVKFAGDNPSVCSLQTEGEAGDGWRLHLHLEERRGGRGGPTRHHLPPPSDLFRIKKTEHHDLEGGWRLEPLTIYMKVFIDLTCYNWCQ